MKNTKLEARIVYHDDYRWPVQLNTHNNGDIVVGTYTVEFDESFYNSDDDTMSLSELASNDDTMSLSELASDDDTMSLSELASDDDVMSLSELDSDDKVLYILNTNNASQKMKIMEAREVTVLSQIPSKF